MAFSMPLAGIARNISDYKIPRYQPYQPNVMSRIKLSWMTEATSFPLRS